jgi:hypothetical protein
MDNKKTLHASSMDGSGLSKGRSAFSLVELLVAVIVLVIVFVGWLRLCNFQAIRKESLRREAIEKAEGYLDFIAKSGAGQGAFYRIEFTDEYEFETADDTIQPLFGEYNPVGYLLEVERRTQGDGWPGANWAVLRLYDQHSVSTISESVDAPFSKMSIFME